MQQNMQHVFLVGDNGIIITVAIKDLRDEIHAGSVVIKDNMDNATAVGNYARIISFDNPAIYLRNKRKVL